MHDLSSGIPELKLGKTRDNIKEEERTQFKVK